MMKNIAFIMGCCHVLILRKSEWNELTGHLKDHRKNQPNSRTNSLQPGKDDVHQDGLFYLLVFYLN
jgi:hypothetical protein